MTAHNPYLAEIAALREENEALRAEIDWLKQASHAPLNIPKEWGIAPRMRQFLEVLMTGQLCSVDRLFAYAYDSHGIDRPSEKSVHVQMWNCRQKLKPHGIEIENIHGVGYRLTTEARRILEGYRAG